MGLPSTPIASDVYRPTLPVVSTCCGGVFQLEQAGLVQATTFK